MQVNKKWLLLAAPLLGALLVLGPLSGRNGSATSARGATPSDRATTESGGLRGSRTGSSPTAADQAGPDLWQIVSTTAGLLILAGVGLTWLSRVRGDRGGSGDAMVNLRQTLRLGQKSRLHAVQFDNRLLLLGETEHSVSLLREMDDPAIAADEREVLGRDDLDATIVGGAEPKDLVQRQAQRAVERAAAAGALTTDAIGDFKALLRRAKAGQVS